MHDIHRAGELINPVNDFIYFLPLKYCENEKLDWLVKNITANVYKLYTCSTLLAQVQNDYLSREEAEVEGRSALNVRMFSVNSIEYFHIKVDTIFDLCYQAYEMLCAPGKIKGAEKYQALEVEFANYNKEKGRALDLKWYGAINKVRNRIVHGGFSIKAFLEGGRVLFQAYNSSLSEQILEDYGFFKKNRNIIFADFYTNFYTRVVHWYVQSFFDFILFKLGVDVVSSEGLDIFSGMCHKSSSTMHVGDEALFIAVSAAMENYSNA